MPACRLFSLSPATPLAVLPLTDDLHDSLHAAYGGGDWIASDLMVSSGDIAFACRATSGSALAFIETDYFGGAGWQGALLVENGAVAWGPDVQWNNDISGRQFAQRPINKALRALGVRAGDHIDEFDAMGLGGYRSLDAVIEYARQIARP